MKTIWGEKLDTNNILQEYPRPQLVRDSYINLNGCWEYCVTNGEKPHKYNEKILVPFSPECELSGEVTKPTPAQTTWYKKNISIPKGFNKGKLILHFGAVDWHAQVFINERIVGEHKGGYTSFSFDITSFLEAKDNDLVVKVTDPSDTKSQPRGKQKTKNGGIWYTPQSGIWQTVWIESVHENYITSIDYIPKCNEEKIQIRVNTNTSAREDCILLLEGKKHIVRTNEITDITMQNFTYWSPEKPHLYSITCKYKKDNIQSYFAMREMTIQKDASGTKRLFLNGKEYFNNGVLDQGYWSDGLYTAPSDEALKYDIQKMKELGFNTLRKHIKVEPMRWYYHCDTIGMLVWQDMINGGGDYKLTTISAPAFVPYNLKDTKYNAFARQDKEGRNQFWVEYKEMLEQLKNCPSIVLWVPFNEGWGQFDSKKAYAITKEIDSTRVIDHASGWHDQGIGDFKSLHIYFRPYKFNKDKKNRAVILSEFGGFSYKEQTGTGQKKTFSYKKLRTREDFVMAVISLFEKEIVVAKKQGLCASIYTQLSDVEEETNGFLSFDRKECKIEKEELKKAFEELI